MRAFSLIPASLAVAATLAGCGGGSGKSTTTGSTKAFDPASNVAYERSYEDCGSVSIADLASRYHVKPNRDKVATAVGEYWAGQAHGGADAVEAGKEGCYDGYKAAGR